MNKLNLEKQAQIIRVLCEGNSIRSTARITDTAINTVVKLLREVGAACLDYQDKAMHNIPSKKLQCDEIWSFVYSKAKNVPEEHAGQFGYGDVWTFTAIDADTKIIPCWLVGQRNLETATEFINDLKERLSNRVQLTTDGHRMYLEAVERAFGADIDFAQLVKLYGPEPEGQKRYSPSECLGAEKHVIQGKPDKADISTSYVERQNLTMRMGMRRFTRLTNGFSKKLENHVYALALYFMHYNFARPHKTLANPYPRTPAMAAGLMTHIWTVEEIVGLLRE
ncbi:MAG: DDE-type integrase/transposase/recombinase [Candidatus Tectomicrobia bacterium]|uniref:DDE-type integrase/transposase/recombinase n=1 Tax=Tectimicrobiota bacterium TaxID=2528274 RepID=A0A933GLQ6_UNCTE|nr:DDE-type integrase/transposase/recombinase [Candidatus Tectomicrobia bacterium]